MIDVKKGRIDLHLGVIVMKFWMDLLLRKPLLNGQTFAINDKVEESEEPDEEMLMDDPLKIALVKAEAEYGFLIEDAQRYTDLLEVGKPFDKLSAYAKLREEEEELVEAGFGQSIGRPVVSVQKKIDTNPRSEEKALKIELKPLPAGLKYALLGPNKTYPVIINADLNNAETALLLCELRKNRRALRYSLDDITGI